MHRKLISIFFVVLIAIFGLSFFITSYFKKSTTELQSSLNAVEKNLADSAWIKSSTSLTEFKNKWEASKDTWSILIDHMEIDNIERSLTRLENSIKINDKNQAIPEAAILKKEVSHIYEKERFNLKNIM